MGNLQLLHDRLRHKAKIDSRGIGPGVASNTAIPPPPFPATYVGPQEPNPAVDTKFRIFATSLLTVLRRSAGQSYLSRASNLTAAERNGLREIRELAKSGAIRVTVSDKGGEFVVLPQELDRAITRLHLQDNTIYASSSREEFGKQYRRLNRKWTEIAKSANLPKG